MKNYIFYFFILILLCACFKQEDKVVRAKAILEENQLNLDDIAKQIKEKTIKINFKLFDDFKCEDKILTFKELTSSQQSYLDKFYESLNKEDCFVELQGYKKSFPHKIDKNDITRIAKEQKQDRKLHPKYAIRFKYCSYNFELELKDKLYLVN